MHKIHAKEFTLEDFSCEHLTGFDNCDGCDLVDLWSNMTITPMEIIKEVTIPALNHFRKLYLETKDKKYWWQMIQLLPSSYNQKRTVMLNYEVLANIYKSRKNHKLDEWAEHPEPKRSQDPITDGYEFAKFVNTFGFCDWVKTLPYSELITGCSEEEEYSEEEEIEKHCRWMEDMAR